MTTGLERFRRGLLSTTRLTPFALFSAGLMLGVQPAPAHAEDATVEDVAVTARHREEKNQDVPLPISTVAGKTLAREQVYRIQDYVTKVPNFFAIQQNPRVSAATIRGLGGNANSDGSESGVGVIVDNVFFTHVGFTWLDFVDLDHIEVVRGPQGTLLGKNTTIGSLVVSTKLPSFTQQASIETTYASRHRGQVRLNVTGPIIDDTLAYRVTFYGDKSDGWVDNQVDGRNFLDNNRFGVRAQFLLLAGSDVRDRLILEHYGTNEYNNFYPPIGDPTVFANGVTPRNGWARKLVTLFGYLPSIDPGKNAVLDNQGRIRQVTDGVSNELNWQLGDHTFTSISAWRRFYFRPHNDSDLTPISIFRAGYDVDVHQYSEELRLTSPTGQTLEYQFGLYGLKEYVFSNNRTSFGPNAAPYFAGALAVPSAVLNGVEYDQYGKATTTSGAVFGQATWHVTDQLALTAGIRDTVENKQGSNTAYAYPPNVLPPALGAIRTAILNGFGGAFALSDSRTTNSISWLVNPSYKINDNILAYFSVAQGEKSGAVNTGATPGASGASPVIIQPERSTDFELGLKTTWLDGKLLLNGNLYWNDISNYQAAVADTSAVTYRSYLTNVGKVRLRGVELEARYSPIENLWLTFGGAFNDARYVSYTNAPAPMELFGGPGTAFPGGVKSVDLSGRRVLGAPEFSGQIGINYERAIDLPFGYHGVGFVWLTQTYRSAVALVNPLSPYGWQSAYGLTSLGVGIRSEDDKYSFQIWAKNVGDRRYFVGAGAATAATPYIGVFGEPRTIGGTLKVSF